MATKTEEKPKNAGKDLLAEELIARNNALKGERSTMDTLHQDIAEYCMPRKSQITTRKTEGIDGFTDGIYEMTMIHSNMTLAAGQLNHVTPANERWSAYEAPPELKKRGNSDAASRWYQECSEIAAVEMARSNFYLEIHEMYLDRGAFGTALLFVDEGKKSTLNFRNWTVGTYSIAQDDEGYVDTVFREFEMTLRQAVQKFGIGNLGKGMTKCWTEKKPGYLEKKYKLIHALYPREDAKHGRRDPENKPIASVYVCVDDVYCVRVHGYEEWPSPVTRYLKWGDSAYGYSPSIEALPTARQVNFIEQQMDALAEIQAFPRVLVPFGMQGDVDMVAGGQTPFDPNNANAMPKEWGTAGRYDIGLQRVEVKKRQIEEAFHVTLFKMFAERTQQMTAREVIERVAEKLVQFSPTFARMTTELLNPLLQRVFMILFRAGKFPDPPTEVLQVTPQGVSLILPEVAYTSKVALAIRALENQSFMQFIEIIAPLLQIDPSAMDAVDIDAAVKGLMKNVNMPVAWQRSEEDIAAIRDQRAKAQEAQAKAEQAALLGKGAKDVSQADPALKQAIVGQTS